MASTASLLLRPLASAAAVLLALPALAAAQSTWNFDITTTGQDVSWLSPTSVDPSATLYSTEYAVTLLEVKVTWLGIPFGPIDATDQIPPEFAAGTGALPGPAPIALLDQPVAFPEPPEPQAFAATLSIGLDGAGFGFASATNVVLGTLQVNLGFPFGTQTVQITSIRMAGSLTIHPTWFDLGQGLAGAGGTPNLVADGTLQAGSLVEISLDSAAPNAASVLVAGFGLLGAPFKGGTMVPNPDLMIPGILTTGLGTLGLSATWPAGVPSGFPIYLQFWIPDAGGPFGFAASNGLLGVSP
ncbi:MAG: hypothetical protein ACT4PU_05295 [Planctomycetota bacterium]